METHHELGGYVFCDDTSRIAKALKQQLQNEGMVCVKGAKGRVPDVASGDSNVWRVAVIPGRAGWHLLLAAPAALLCESSPDGKIRFASLCDALGAPGLLREANQLEDGVDVQGQVHLLSDGKGLHGIFGKLLDFDAGHESVEYFEGDGEPAWRGHAIDHGDISDDANPWHAVSAAFPEDDDKDPDLYEPNLSEAQHSLWFVERLGGRKLSAYWDGEGEAWGALSSCLVDGESVPIEGAITLAFQWSGRDRKWPKQDTPWPRPPFEYGDGSTIHIGDHVRLKNGTEGQIVNLLSSTNERQTWARYAAVRVDGQVRMVSMAAVKRDTYRFIDLTCLRATAEAEMKPLVEDLEQLAETGDVSAMVQLGFIYCMGDGLHKNPAGSSKWLAAAAKQNHPDACYLLAENYRSEFGVRYNRDKILALAKAGYRHGSEHAAAVVIDYEPHATQLDTIQTMTREGNAIAQFELAKRLQEGKELPQDMTEAARLFELSAAQGYYFAPIKIGACYDAGEGVAEDPARAAYWYSEAIARGDRWAYPPLAKLYSEGRGVDKDLERATALLEYAAKEGIPGAKEALDALGKA